MTAYETYCLHVENLGKELKGLDNFRCTSLLWQLWSLKQIMDLEIYDHSWNINGYPLVISQRKYFINDKLLHKLYPTIVCFGLYIIYFS
jgi:hypothetical protein